MRLSFDKHRESFKSKNQIFCLTDGRPHERTLNRTSEQKGDRRQWDTCLGG